MTKLTYDEILELKLEPNNDAEVSTVREYLHALLTRVWVAEECFSGKRPFGNSGWQHELAFPLVKANVINGVITTDSYNGETYTELEDYDSDKLHDVVLELIDYVFGVDDA